MGGYRTPASLAEALSLLAAAPEPPLLLAGGTDIYPARAMAEAWGRHVKRPVLDLSGLGLAGIEDCGDHHRIGAGTSWATLRDAPLPRWFDGLRQAARQVGGVQVQARGTVLGNLCNASPAADGVPPLLALDARVELASLRGSRRLPLTAFILGNRRTALAPDEIATAVLVPKPAGEMRSAFLKLGARAYLVISIVMVAGLLQIEAGRIAAARLAIGACSPVAQRLPTLEAALIGARPEEAAALVAPDHLAPLSPIDDVRATAEYRRHTALVLLRRLLAGFATPQALAA
ncbi:FAD binding domain-containing protein [Siccirubricoccus sp. KC 17139]|uniref:FAD binding domain-containing protein n=1 Tax=Siccirubricoccus soli TaxID=2899147 RepID=A0ABT1D1H9_9PROT|nr:FAD binding domain-containing protein [Siccirubricoccus soli]MCO6415744.1 FAD binding domain-containing protein [Siccirubricoccus soli]MCP2681876.1 FAD binding domain-containing protein [Siccirubricoccus soli]